MRLAYRDTNYKQELLTVNRNYISVLPELDTSKKWYLGIDASTTSFGIALETVDGDYSILIQCMREPTDNYGNPVLSQAMDLLKEICFDLDFEMAVYERTPDNFKPKTFAEKIMIQTETTVRTYLEQGLTIDKQYIIPIYPASWKSIWVPKNLLSNKGKTVKRENAYAVLENAQHTLPLDTTLMFFDNIPHHDYDGIEALGILKYGTKFLLLNKEKDLRVYRDFEKTTNSYVLYSIVNLEDKDDFIKHISDCLQVDLEIYYENQTKCLTQNLYALSSNVPKNCIVIYGGDSTASCILSVITKEILTSDKVFIGLSFPYSDKITPLLNALNQISSYKLQMLKI